MILLLTGPDSYRVNERKHALVSAFQKKYDAGGNNITALSGATVDRDALMTQVRTVGLFSSHRMLVIDRLSVARKPVLKDIAAFLEKARLPDEVIVLIVEPELALEPKRGERVPASIGAYLKALQGNANITSEAYPAFTPRERKLWAKRRLEALDASIEESALTRLLAACGEDTWLLAHELDKLAARAAGGQITDDHVAEMTVGILDVNIFALTDALGEAKGKRALFLLEEHLQSGETPAYLFAMLGRHFRLLLQAKEAAEEYPHPQALAKALAVHPFVARKALEQARRFSLPALTTLHNNLLSAEFTMKTTRVDPEVLLERLLVPLAV